MNRIKYRVYDSISKKMHNWNKVKTIPLVDFELDHYTIMQHTGLRDIVGHDIYEGDILEFDASEWGSDTSNKFIVYWNARNGEWCTGGGTNDECGSWKTIIGNICEDGDMIAKCRVGN